MDFYLVIQITGILAFFALLAVIQAPLLIVIIVAIILGLPLATEIADAITEWME